MQIRRHWLTLAVVASLAGCASIPEKSAYLDPDRGFIEIVDVPFFAQDEYQCGPAALATILVHSGVATTAEDIVPQVYLPKRKGSLQFELLAATRAVGRIPYVIDPSLSAVYAELVSNRPVLVLQNLGIQQLPRWHYAVVVGLDPGRGKVFLRSGADRRRATDLRTFLRTWQRGEFWAFVALQAGELPARADAMRFAEAVSAAERSGHDAVALASWGVAVERWRESPVALFGLANAEFRTRNFARAESLYRRVMLGRPDNLLAGNNLALALAHQGKQEKAIEEINRIIQRANLNDPLMHEYIGTLQEIHQMTGTTESSQE